METIERNTASHKMVDGSQDALRAIFGSRKPFRVPRTVGTNRPILDHAPKADFGRSWVGNIGPDIMMASQEGVQRATFRKILENIDRDSADLKTLRTGAGRILAPPRYNSREIPGGANPNPGNDRIMSHVVTIIDTHFSEVEDIAPV